MSILFAWLVTLQTLKILSTKIHRDVITLILRILLTFEGGGEYSPDAVLSSKDYTFRLKWVL